MATQQRHQRGVNLIEIVVAMSIAAISLAVGVPSFQNLRISSDRSSAIIELVSSARLARSEAALRGTPASICTSTDGETCSGSSEWTDGWLIFRDVDGDHQLDTSEDTLVKQVRFRNPQFTISAISGITDGMTFRQFGFVNPPQAPGQLQYEDSQESRCLDLTFIGRFNVSTGGCS
jgi:prepilin-type N-terminal cleavage/methylation domain-containing protein